MNNEKEIKKTLKNMIVDLGLKIKKLDNEKERLQTLIQMGHTYDITDDHFDRYSKDFRKKDIETLEETISKIDLYREKLMKQFLTIERRCLEIASNKLSTTENLISSRILRKSGCASEKEYIENRLEEIQKTITLDDTINFDILLEQMLNNENIISSDSMFSRNIITTKNKEDNKIRR